MDKNTPKKTPEKALDGASKPDAKKTSAKTAVATPKMGWAQRYLSSATKGQRKALLLAAILCVLLLVASIALVIVVETQLVSPTPTTAAESEFIRAREAESSAVTAALAQGEAVDTFPAVVSARMQMVEAQISLGQLTAAQRMVDALVKANPDNMRAAVVQGNISELNGDYNQALSRYRSVMDRSEGLDPEFRREALRGIGNSLLNLGDEVQALDALTQAAIIPPESISLHLTAGDLAYKLERWQQAALHFYSVLRFEPSNATALDRLKTIEADHRADAESALEALTGGGNAFADVTTNSGTP
ncbi:MAG: tetratricopeptide repeat protein [Coriobacteriia bacterium]|nr:tetratricopeptide repeat protein [Coriobacteriia bacterium]MCL2536812.1 tetratricopeptide repeat protein [Coriobacteriia bacterium]